MHELDTHRLTSISKEKFLGYCKSSLIYLVLLAGGIVMMIPFYWALITSFMNASETNKFPIVWIPTKLTLQWIRQSLNTSFIHYYVNSIVVAVCVVISVVITSALGGYIFAKFKFPLRNFLFMVVLATMMVPFTVTLIPTYVIVSVWFKLQDTLAAMVVPALVSAFGIFLMRQFTETLPDELLDAARIDGASEMRIFWQIILPLCKPALSATAIFTFIGIWNDYLWPVLVTDTDRSRTLPVGVATFAQARWAQTNLVVGASLLVLIPMVIIYFIFQREFVQGVVMTGLKY